MANPFASPEMWATPESAAPAPASAVPPAATQYDPLFQKHGAAQGVDPLLLKAQANVESAFNPQAQSSVGAQGLMQLMPPIQKKFGVTDPADPDQNIGAGAALMKENLAASGGDAGRALLMYHGGPDAKHWGPKTAAYREKVLAEHARLLQEQPQAKNPFDAPGMWEAPQEGGRGVVGTLKDTGIALAQGVVDFPGSLYGLANAVSFGAADKATAYLDEKVRGLPPGEGETFSTKLVRAKQIIQDAIGQSSQLTAKQQELGNIAQNTDSEVQGFFTSLGYVMMNPDLAAHMFAQSLPSMVGIGAATRALVGRAVAKGASKELAEKAGERANVIANGVLEGGSTANDTMQAIMGMSDAQLRAASSDYRELVDVHHKTPQEAKSIIAGRAVSIASVIAGAIGGAATKLTGAGKFEADVFGKGLTMKTGVKAAVTHVGQEALEEGVQNAGDVVGQNVGTKLSGANPKQPVMQGTGAAAGAGAAFGAVTGAAFHGAGSILGKGEKPAPPPAPPAPSLTFGDKTITNTPDLQAHLESIPPQDRLAAIAQALKLSPEEPNYATLKAALESVPPEQHAALIGQQVFGDKPAPPKVTQKTFEQTVEQQIKALHAERAALVANLPEDTEVPKPIEKKMAALDQRILALQGEGERSLLADANAIFKTATDQPKSILATIEQAKKDMPEAVQPTVDELVKSITADPEAIFGHATQTPDVVRTIAQALRENEKLANTEAPGVAEKAPIVAKPATVVEQEPVSAHKAAEELVRATGNVLKQPAIHSTVAAAKKAAERLGKHTKAAAAAIAVSKKVAQPKPSGASSAEPLAPTNWTGVPSRENLERTPAERHAVEVSKAKEKKALDERLALRVPKANESRGVNVEVAPNPQDKALTENFNKLTEAQKTEVTKEIGDRLIPDAMKDMDIAHYAIEHTVGGFEGGTNPSIIVHFGKDVTHDRMVEAGKVLGHVFSQQAVIAYDESITTGENLTGFVKVKPSRALSYAESSDLYKAVFKAVPEASGFTAREGALVFGNFSQLSDSEFHAKIDAALKVLEKDYEATSEFRKFRSDWIEPVTLEGTRYESHTGQDKGAVLRGQGRNHPNSLRTDVARSIADALGRKPAKATGEPGAGEQGRVAPAEKAGPPDDVVLSEKISRREFLGALGAAALNSITPIARAAKQAVGFKIADSDVAGTPLRWIVENSKDASARDIASRILPIAEKTTITVIHPGRQYAEKFPGQLAFASGVTTRRRVAPHEIKIYLRGDVGLNEDTVLHEAIHAATINVLTSERERVTKSEASKRLDALAKIVREKGPALATTRQERFAVQSANESVEEFVAWGLSNPEFQNVLRRIKVEGTSAWDRFVNFISRILGIGNSEAGGMKSALDELIDAGHMLIDQAKREAMMKQAMESGAVFAQRNDQTATPAFKRWFGASKVVNEFGEPLRVYHGTAKDFAAFKIPKAKPMRNPYWAGDIGSWFVGESKEKGNYDEDNAEYQGNEYIYSGSGQFGTPEEFKPGARIIPVFLSIQNPMEYDGHESFMEHWEEFESGKAMRDGLQKQGFDGIVIRNSMTDGNVDRDDWVAFKPEQIKSALGNRGTFDPNEVDINMQRRDGQIVNDVFSDAGKDFLTHPKQQRTIYIKRGNKAIDLVNKFVGNKLSVLGDMPNQDLYTVQRGVAMGLIAQADEAAGKIGDIFNGASDADRKAVYDYWTNVYGTVNNISDLAIRKAAIETKQAIVDIGEKLVKRGLISEESFLANKGKYAPRLYLKYLLDESANRMIGHGKSISDVGYSKQRKDIPEEIRRLILGEITEPGFLGAMAVGKPLRDIAILDFLETISKNEDWAWRPSMVEYKGQLVSIAWLKNEAARLREQATYYTDPVNKKDTEDIAADMETVYTPLYAKLGKPPENYTEIPDTPRYGLMRGMLVRNEIYNDLVGAANMSLGNKSWAENFLGYGGIGTKLQQAWKTSKVALNPPGQIRNMISNWIMLHLSGIPMHMLPKRLAQAIEAMRTKNKYWDVAQRYGVSKGNFGSEELYRMEHVLLKDTGEGGPLAFLRYAKLIATKAGDLYQLTETMGKLAKIIDVMENGGGEAEAALEAQKWLFDYSFIPRSVRYIRNAPVGVPFLTYYYKLLPRLMEVALTAPHRFLPYVAMAYVLPMMTAAAVGSTPDDLEKLKKALPEWLREKGHVYMLPNKDATGRWQFLDLSYFIPWTMFQDAVKQTAEGKFSDLLGTSGVASGILTDLFLAIKTNIDPFTKREIANKGDPVNLQVGAWMTYLYNMMAPPWLTNRGLIGPDLGDPTSNFGGKIHQNLFDTTNKFGEPRQTNMQTLGSAMGINLYPINPGTSRVSEMQRMVGEVYDAERVLKLKLGDKGLTEAARQKVIDTYRAEMAKRIEKIKKYAEESEVPASLQ